MGSDPPAVVALGANLGNPRQTLLQAMTRLARLSVQPLRRSSLWQTAPIDCPPGSPVFLNAVVGLWPNPLETPESLWRKLQDLEYQFGRARTGQLNEPRPLDLDLIAFGDVICVTAQLILPHPRAGQRRFVLEPLAEIAPDYVLPGQDKTVRQLLQELGCAQVVTRLSW